METLFGADMPLAVRFFIAFLIVLGLIGATAWAVRRFGGGRLGSASARGRQPRLAVIDTAPVDGRRRLILIRRDNVEHLLMIGGPSDVVVEPNIVRGVAAPREAPPVRPSAIGELGSRPAPLPEAVSWPLQPEPAPAPPPRPLPRPVAAAPAPAPAEDNGTWPLQPHVDAPPPRIPRDPLAGLADELTARPPRERAPAPPREAPPPREHAPPPPRAQAPEPRIPAPPPAAAAPAAPDDQSLAEMAHRLEAALRKPGAAADAAPPPPRAPRPAEPRAPRSEPKAPPPRSLYENLEQEMASLLGRPAGKT